MKIAISNDHGAVYLKQEISAHLQNRSDVEVINFGTNTEARVEYPGCAAEVAEKVAAGDFDLGILLCGTGAGMSIAANKIRGIRAVVCSEPYTARLAREHNNANILCIGARVVGSELGKMIADTFLDARFKGGRHKERVDMITELETSRII